MTVYEWQETLGELITDLEALRRLRKKQGIAGPTKVYAEVLQQLVTKTNAREVQQYLFQEANMAALEIVLDGYLQICEGLASGRNLPLAEVKDLPSAVVACARLHVV